MKNLVLGLGLAVVLTSCQKDELKEIGTDTKFKVERMFEDVAEHDLQSEACEPINATNVQSTFKNFTINSNGYISFTDINYNVYFYNIEFVDEYEVFNVDPVDGSGTYPVEALRLYSNNGELTDNYILLLDFCDDDLLTLYFTETEQMIYLRK